MSDDAFEAEVIVTRKPPPPTPPPYVCCACQRPITPGPWEAYDRDPAARPFCRPCIQHWGGRLARISGTTWGDHAVLLRLKAATECLQWESINGRR